MAETPPRVELARLPTRVQRLRGVDAWIKRDDLTGVALSGNKVRKLEFALAEAEAAAADTLITCGGLQSNHCRATATVARQLGMEVVLVLRGEPPTRLEGNFFLDKLLGAQVRYVTPQEYARRDAVMTELAQAQRDDGRRPYVIPEGCSGPVGCWGYIEACREIAQAQGDLGVTFDAIVHAVGSGGTSAGLEIGVRRHGLSAKVWGVAVCDDAPHFQRLVSDLVAETSQRYGLGVDVAPNEIGIIDGYVGPGYGVASREVLQTIVDTARGEGLVLDPAYTGKAFHALLRERARFGADANVLFLHTGGIYGLFPHAASLAPLLG